MKNQITKILSNERSSKSQIGIMHQEFMILLPYFSKLDEEDRRKRQEWKRNYWGKPPILENSEQRLFYVLWYLKTYPTFDTAWAVRWWSKAAANKRFLRYFILLKEALRQLWALPPETPEEFVSKYGEDQNLWDVFVDASEREVARSKKK